MKMKFRRLISLLITVAMLLPMIPVLPTHVHATSHSLLDGKVTVADSNNTSSVDGSTVIIKATSTSYTSRKTNNVTVTNDSGKSGTLSEKWK